MKILIKHESITMKIHRVPNPVYKMKFSTLYAVVKELGNAEVESSKLCENYVMQASVGNQAGEQHTS